MAEGEDVSRRGGAGALRAAALAAAFAALASGCGERGDERAKGGTGALYHYRLAAEKYREGDFDAAIDIYERSLQMNPKLAEAHLDLGIINDEELVYVKKVLGAAALTYVAATLQAILTLLYYVMRFTGGSNRD